jgi:hypothetical protein
MASWGIGFAADFLGIGSQKLGVSKRQQIPTPQSSCAIVTVRIPGLFLHVRQRQPRGLIHTGIGYLSSPPAGGVAATITTINTTATITAINTTTARHRLPAARPLPPVCPPHIPRKRRDRSADGNLSASPAAIVGI